MQKIAVFGGTFNPIHNGHLHIAEEFAKRLKADKVIFIPANIPPHKQAPDLAPAARRLKMCRMAAEENHIFQVSNIEIRRGGASYTSETLEQLKLIYPDAELFLLMGEDMFLTLEQWHDPQTIFRLATVCAAPRSSSKRSRLKSYASHLAEKGVRTFIEDISYLPVSSTIVREAVKAGRSISSLVPKKVERYILENRLYME